MAWLNSATPLSDDALTKPAITDHLTRAMAEHGHLSTDTKDAENMEVKENAGRQTKQTLAERRRATRDAERAARREEILARRAQPSSHPPALIAAASRRTDPTVVRWNPPRSTLRPRVVPVVGALVALASELWALTLTRLIVDTAGTDADVQSRPGRPGALLTPGSVDCHVVCRRASELPGRRRSDAISARNTMARELGRGGQCHAGTGAVGRPSVAPGPFDFFSSTRMSLLTPPSPTTSSASDASIR